VSLARRDGGTLRGSTVHAAALHTLRSVIPYFTVPLVDAYDERSPAGLWSTAFVGAGVLEIFRYSYGDHFIKRTHLRYSMLNQVPTRTYCTAPSMGFMINSPAVSC
jgi:hypothetical protein